MIEEINSLKQMKTWKLATLPSGQNAVRCKWVYKIKTDSSGKPICYKARLVAKGFTQEHGIDYDETFSPVARYESFRILCALAAANDWEIHQMDVNTAFLNGDLEEEIYMEQPPGFIKEGQEHKVLRLQKAIYGLKQALRQWNKKLHATLFEMGFSRTYEDYGIYVGTSDKYGKNAKLFIIVYVDNIVLFGNKLAWIKDVKARLSSVYSMKDLGDLEHFLGIRVLRDRKRRKLWLDQQTYLEDVLIKFGFENSSFEKTPLAISTKLKKNPIKEEDLKGQERGYLMERRSWFQSFIGSVQYAVMGTRPDLAHAASALASYSSNPSKDHITAAKHVLQYINATKALKLEYYYIRNTDDTPIDVEGYCDASWGENPDHRRSQTGFCYFLAGGVVSWASKLQITPAQSSTESEYITLSSAAKHGKWLQNLLIALKLNGKPIPEIYTKVQGSGLDFMELMINTNEVSKQKLLNGHTLEVYCDNQGAIALANNPGNHQRTKHIDIKHHFIRYLAENGEIKITYLSTDQMIADIFTKQLGIEKFRKHRDDLCQVML